MVRGGRPRRQMLLGVLAAASTALVAACSDVGSATLSQSPGTPPGSPAPTPSPAAGAAPGVSPSAAIVAPGPISTSVQILPSSASPLPSAGVVTQARPPLPVPARMASPPAGSAPTGPLASPAVSPGPLASPVPLPIVLGRPGLLAVADGGSIVLVDPSGQQPPRTLIDGPDSRAPRWSPDGQRLVITGGLGPAAELLLVPAGGGPPQRLTNNARPEHHAVWSPRGDRIAYVLPRSTSARTRSGTVDPTEPEEVWLLTVATGATAKLADGFDPSWSPDGLRLAYATNGQRDVHGARGNAIHVIGAGGGADGQGDRPVLAVADLPDDLLPRFGLPFKPATVRLRAPSWSPDGTRLVVSADGHTSMALSLDERGQDMRPWALAYEGGVGRAHWAPDGQRLAVESLPATGVAVVVLAEVVGRRETPLGGPSAGFQAASPTWAADGQHLALIASSLPARRTEPRETALRIFGADGTARETLLTAPALRDPAWGLAPAP